MKDDLETKLRQEAQELGVSLSDPKIYQKSDYPQLAKREKELQTLIAIFDQIANLKRQREDAEKLAQTSEADLATLAKSEISQIDEEIEEASKRLNQLLQNKPDENDNKNCLVEIRAGVGGSESSLFAADLYRMYLRFNEKQSWQTVLISENPSEIGGFKEIIFEVKGKNAYRYLKFESGVHRVQRVPATESQGRVHTSTASVAVMVKAEEKDLEITANDIRIDTYRSSGHGGQSVNKTDSAVRITHLPSGMIVICQDEKSQFKNKEKALDVLRARLLQKQKEENEEAASSKRQKLIGKALRNEKIRTYNFPQDRLTDHRINLSLSNLPAILNGELLPLIEKLNQTYDDSPTT